MGINGLLTPNNPTNDIIEDQTIGGMRKGKEVEEATLAPKPIEKIIEGSSGKAPPINGGVQPRETNSNASLGVDILMTPTPPISGPFGEFVQP